MFLRAPLAAGRRSVPRSTENHGGHPVTAPQYDRKGHMCQDNYPVARSLNLTRNQERVIFFLHNEPRCFNVAFFKIWEVPSLPSVQNPRADDGEKEGGEIIEGNPGQGHWQWSWKGHADLEEKNSKRRTFQAVEIKKELWKAERIPTTQATGSFAAPKDCRFKTQVPIS